MFANVVGTLTNVFGTLTQVSMNEWLPCFIWRIEEQFSAADFVSLRPDQLSEVSNENSFWYASVKFKVKLLTIYLKLSKFRYRIVSKYIFNLNKQLYENAIFGVLKSKYECQCQRQRLFTILRN